MSIATGDNTVPSTPNPAPAAIVYAALRAVLMIVGILGVTLPAALGDTGTLQAIAGAVSTLIGIGWQVVAEYQHAHAVHSAAQASAQLSRAVQMVSPRAV